MNENNDHSKTKKDKHKFRNRSEKKFRRNDEISKIVNRYEINFAELKTFSEFPFSRQTLEGLRKAKYFEPTEIQREAIGLALKGCDVLGAAKTGSGKTLAFVIPILECLWRNKWSQLDGLGALVVSPTRELALQTYETLRLVGCKHDFSAALIIGGTDVKYQSERISRTNIIVCTPGRILQHMDENPSFNCDNLQLLILDEADRILDMGFQQQINALVANLAPTRQTLLFSATQTKSVKDLARLSLKNPMYVSVHEHAEHSTPSQLKQSYMVCSDEDKLNLLWSFIKNHLNSKILAFFTNCKQVRFVYESFRHLRPGTPVMALHGSMNQMKRVDVYQQFCRKQRAVLFATDIAARGLDFPAVDWVVQVDCPSDAVEYIHRSGRTARFRNDGQSLLFLTNSQEKPMLAELERKKIPISRINVNRAKLYSVQKKLEILCAKDQTLKTYGQRAFVAYIRSIFVMSNKNIFDVKTIGQDALAQSFGLANAPRVRFLKRMDGNEKKIESTDEISSNEIKMEQSSSAENNDDDDLLTVKKLDVFNVLNENDEKNEEKDESKPRKEKTEKILSKSMLARKLSKKNVRVNKKIVYTDNDDDNSAVQPVLPLRDEVESSSSFRFDIEEAKRRMREEDKIDREMYRKKIRAKHQEERRKAKLAEAERRGRQVSKKFAQNDEDEVEVVLGTPDEEASGLSDQDSVEFDEPATKKRKKVTPESRKRRKKSVGDQSTLNEIDEEELALRLLENS